MYVKVRLLINICCFFRLKRCDADAARVSVTDGTQVEEIKGYDYPSNPKIKFWDLPGFGTREKSDLDTYCNEVEMEKYQAFLIFTKERFTKVDEELAEKVGKMGKKFFFIRAKIDQDISNEQIDNNSFNEEDVLTQIRAYCSKNLGDSLKKEENIFLISNHYTAKWDFHRLREAILDAMPKYEQESLILSLSARSTDVLKRKVEVLKSRVKYAAALSGAVGVLPAPGVSIAADIPLIVHELSFYKLQLGLPEEGSEKFLKLSNGTQNAVKAILSVINGISHATLYAAREAVEEVTRAFPVVGWLVAGALSWTGTYYILNENLKEMERVAFLVLQEALDTNNQ